MTNRLKIPFFLGLLISSIFLYSSASFALKSDAEQVIDISADHLEMDEKNHISTYSGHVVLKQGSLNIQADTLVLHFDLNNELEFMQLSGSPARLKQLNDKQELMQGTADSIKYEDKKSLLTLKQNAEFTSGNEHINSHFIQINTDNEYIKAGKKDKNNRVHMKISPRQK